MEETKYKYDVTLSFAGEDREFVSCVAKILKDNNINLFYDEYEQVKLWGKDLYTYLDEIYRNNSRFCVMFISKHYKEKLWTSHERESAQARAFRENEEYILPFRIDDTAIPGIRETTGYLSKNNCNCECLANAIIEKVGSKIIQEKTHTETKKESVKKIEPGVFLHPNGQYEITLRKYDFFSQRLISAFPGNRGLKWYNDPNEIIERLNILLSAPLVFELYPFKSPDIFDSVSKPVWWFRGGPCMPIEKFKIINNSKCLIDHNECEIDKIAVYRDGKNYRDFIYVKLKAEPPVKNGENTDQTQDFQLSYKSYAVQEYAIYDDKVITREEYDDWAAVINQKVIQFEKTPELRIRHLTPYNFIICSQTSVYNSRESDDIFGKFLNDVLKTNDDESLENLLSELGKIDSELRHTDLA